MKLTVTFQVEGTVTQEIEMPDDCNLSRDEIVKALNRSHSEFSAFTSLEEEGNVPVFKGGDHLYNGRVTVIEDYDVCYRDFTVEE